MILRRHSVPIVVAFCLLVLTPPICRGHGTVVYPKSRVYRVFESNPTNPNFPLAVNAVQTDGQLSYYTWNEVSRNIPQAVQAGLPPGFDYSPWMPDGEIASAGRTDPNSTDYPRTYAGLDQVSADWPKTPVNAGETITVDFFATAVHSPSVWDVWMTKPTWDPSMPLTWNEMEFLGRPTVALANSHFTFDLTIPTDRSGHHVLWVAWQRNDPVGEVFISASDIDIRHYTGSGEDLSLGTGVNASATTLPNIKATTQGDTVTVSFDSPLGGYDGTLPLLLANVFPTGSAPTSPPGYAEIHVDPLTVVILFDGTSPPAPLPPGGVTFSSAVAPGLAGFSALLQVLALAPSANTGHVVTASDGHEFIIF